MGVVSRIRCIDLRRRVVDTYCSPGADVLCRGDRWDEIAWII